MGFVVGDAVDEMVVGGLGVGEGFVEFHVVLGSLVFEIYFGLKVVALVDVFLDEALTIAPVFKRTRNLTSCLCTPPRRAHCTYPICR